MFALFRRPGMQTDQAANIKAEARRLKYESFELSCCVCGPELFERSLCANESLTHLSILMQMKTIGAG